MFRDNTNNLLALLTLCSVLAACSAADDKQRVAARLALAESLIDDFYSFDTDRLNVALTHAEDSKPSLLFYQGWAEGGNYKVLNRRTCVMTEANKASCAITVEDDPMLALGLDFKVTDTFTIGFTDDRVTSVETSSNDLPIYYVARTWVLDNRPDLLELPCEGFFNGGPTPGACAKAVTEGYRLFAASDDFPTEQ